MEPDAFDGTGGLCFALFLDDYDLNQNNDETDDKHSVFDFPTNEMAASIEELLIPTPTVTRKINKLSYTLLIGEPVLNMLTRIHFDWVIEESGHILFDVSVVSR